MRKANNFSTGLIAFAIMLLFSPLAWSQNAAPSTRNGSLSPGNVSSSATPTVKSTKSHEVTAMEQLRNYSKQNPAASDNDPQYAILKTRAVLEQGQKDHSLNDLQVKAMREKINAMEVQLKNGSAAKSAAFNKIMTEKKCSRAEFLSLTLDQQRNALQKERAVRITDLVNERSSDLQLLQNGRYITEETFMNADIMRQISILQNPSAYRVVKNGTALPKTQISTAQLNELSAEKRQAIIESNNFEITK